MTQHLIGAAETINADNTCYYWLIGMTNDNTASLDMTERMTIIPYDGTFSNLKIETENNPGVSVVYTVMVDGQATSLTATMAAGSTVCASTGSCSVIDGQNICLRADPNGTTNNDTFHRWTIDYEPDVHDRLIIMGGDNLSHSGTQYNSIWPSIRSTDSNECRIPMPCSGMAGFLWAKTIDPLGTGNTMEFEVLRNGSDTGLDTEIIGSTMTKNSDLSATSPFGFSPGDTIQMRTIETGTGSDPVAWGFCFFPAGVICNNIYSGQSSDNTGGYMRLLSYASGFQEDHFSRYNINQDFFNLFIRTDVAPGVGKSYTATLYVNGSPTSLTTTISGTDTASSNTSDYVTVSAGDRVNIYYYSTGSPSSTVLSYSVLTQDVGAHIAYGNIKTPLISGAQNPLSGGRTIRYPIHGSAWHESDSIWARSYFPISGTLRNWTITSTTNVAENQWIKGELIVEGVRTLTATIDGPSDYAVSLSETSVSAGDRAYVRITTSTTLNGIHWARWSSEFEQDSNIDAVVMGTGNIRNTSAWASAVAVPNGIDDHGNGNQKNQGYPIEYTGAPKHVAYHLYHGQENAPGVGEYWTSRIVVGGLGYNLTTSISGTDTEDTNLQDACLLWYTGWGHGMIPSDQPAATYTGWGFRITPTSDPTQRYGTPWCSAPGAPISQWDPSQPRYPFTGKDLTTLITTDVRTFVVRYCKLVLSHLRVCTHASLGTGEYFSVTITTNGADTSFTCTCSPEIYDTSWSYINTGSVTIDALNEAVELGLRTDGYDASGTVYCGWSMRSTIIESTYPGDLRLSDDLSIFSTQLLRPNQLHLGETITLYNPIIREATEPIPEEGIYIFIEDEAGMYRHIPDFIEGSWEDPGFIFSTKPKFTLDIEDDTGKRGGS